MDDLGLWEQEIFALRDVQFGAQPGQPLDSDTIFAFEIERVRDLDSTADELDTNTELVRRWDGVR